MNKLLRNGLLRSGIPFLRDIAIRSVRRAHARRHGAFQAEAYPRLYPQGGPPVVLNGPFAGMLYLNEPVWGSITPRWIGSYESCLWDVVNEIIARRYECIIDVGCAEGYYAVGLCRALPGATVHAHDLDRDSLRQVVRLWKLNGSPGRLETGGRLDAGGLARCGRPGSLLVCDIEGGELGLLDPGACAALRAMDVLVEVHRAGGETVAANADRLRRRFESTHAIVTRDDSHRVREYARISALDEPRRGQALSEGRPSDQVWLWMKRK